MSPFFSRSKKTVASPLSSPSTPTPHQNADVYTNVPTRRQAVHYSNYDPFPDGSALTFHGPISPNPNPNAPKTRTRGSRSTSLSTPTAPLPDLNRYVNALNRDENVSLTKHRSNPNLPSHSQRQARRENQERNSQIRMDIERDRVARACGGVPSPLQTYNAQMEGPFSPHSNQTFLNSMANSQPSVNPTYSPNPTPKPNLNVNGYIPDPFLLRSRATGGSPSPNQSPSKLHTPRQRPLRRSSLSQPPVDLDILVQSSSSPVPSTSTPIEPQFPRPRKIHPHTLLSSIAVIIRSSSPHPTDYGRQYLVGTMEQDAEIIGEVLNIDDLMALYEQDMMESVERGRGNRDRAANRRSFGPDDGGDGLAVFGVSLRQVSLYASSTAILGGYQHDLPIVVFACVEELYRTGIYQEGLFRTLPNRPRLLQLISRFDTGPHFGDPNAISSSTSNSNIVAKAKDDSIRSSPTSTTDLHSETMQDICALLSTYLSSLPEPVLSPAIFDGLWTWCVKPSLERDERLWKWHQQHQHHQSPGTRSRSNTNPSSHPHFEERSGSPNLPPEDLTFIESPQIAIARHLLQLLPSANLSLLVYLLAFFTQVPLAPANGIQFEDVARIFAGALLGAGGVNGGAKAGAGKGTGSTSLSGRMLVWLLTRWGKISDGLFEWEDVHTDTGVGNLAGEEEQHQKKGKGLMIVAGSGSPLGRHHREAPEMDDEVSWERTHIHRIISDGPTEPSIYSSDGSWNQAGSTTMTPSPPDTLQDTERELDQKMRTPSPDLDEGVHPEIREVKNALKSVMTLKETKPLKLGGPQAMPLSASDSKRGSRIPQRRSRAPQIPDLVVPTASEGLSQINNLIASYNDGDDTSSLISSFAIQERLLDVTLPVQQPGYHPDNAHSIALDSFDGSSLTSIEFTHDEDSSIISDNSTANADHLLSAAHRRIKQLERELEQSDAAATEAIQETFKARSESRMLSKNLKSTAAKGKVDINERVEKGDDTSNAVMDKEMLKQKLAVAQAERDKACGVVAEIRRLLEKA